MGHFASVCWSKYVSEVSGDSGGATKGNSIDRWFLGALSSDSDQDDKWKVHLKVGSKVVMFKIDTSADITAIISLPLTVCLHPFFSPGGTLQCEGQF